MAAAETEALYLQWLRETLDEGLRDWRPVSAKEARAQVERAMSGYTVNPAKASPRKDDK